MVFSRFAKREQFGKPGSLRCSLTKQRNSCVFVRVGSLGFPFCARIVIPTPCKTSRFAKREASFKQLHGLQRKMIQTRPISMNDTLFTIGTSSVLCPTSPAVSVFGNRWCAQCAAKSKRSGQRCRNPVVKGKRTCRMHGGKSTGPRTSQGRKRCADAKTVHGKETRQRRAERRVGLFRLRELEEQARQLGVITGPRTPGRRSG